MDYATLIADHCTFRGTQGTFQSHTTLFVRTQFVHIQIPAVEVIHSRQPTDVQPKPAVVEVPFSFPNLCQRIQFSSANQSAAPEIPTVSVPSIDNNGVSQRNDSQFYLYLNALPKYNLDTIYGDATMWTDWNSHFKVMIAKADMSISQKYACLQGSVK